MQTAERIESMVAAAGGEVSPDGIDLMLELLEPSPAARITAWEALDHEYFS